MNKHIYTIISHPDYLSAPLTLMCNEIRYPIGVCMYVYIYLYLHIYTISSQPDYLSAPLTLLRQKICHPIGVYLYIYIYLQIHNSINNKASFINYRVAKTHRIPYLCRLFSAKVTYT